MIPVPPPKRIILDTDPGVDDALTILLALASPEIQLEALTTTQGNVTVEQGTRNALAVLELLGASDIPVAQGTSLPLVGPLRASDHVHGFSGLGSARLPEPTMKPVPQHAIDYLIEQFLPSPAPVPIPPRPALRASGVAGKTGTGSGTVRGRCRTDVLAAWTVAEPGELSLFAIGPLTNVALAIRKEPRFASAVKEMVIMGGSIREGGNITPQAEFNIYADPHAAYIVFHSGIPITLIPLDVTYKTLLYPAQLDRLKSFDSPISQFIVDSTAGYAHFTESKTGIPGCALHDPLTLATFIAPELLTLEEHYVDVDISGGVSTGNTFADFYHITGRKPNMKVALDVRGEEFVELFLKRMETLCKK